MARITKIFDAHPDVTQVGQDKPRDMPTEGPARITPQEIEPVTSPNWRSHADELAFMEEPVEIIVHESTDKNAENPIQIGVNGRNQFIYRGEPLVVKRKYVEVLARAKPIGYTQQHYKDGNGDDAIRMMPHTGLRYPFSVNRDENPRGRDWLRNVLAEA